tara:strand:+ start:168 stop:389 length:222 start_codon:yes stop_codon:yes gene_type:complete
MNEVEEQLEDLRDRLIVIADELADLGLAAIQSAINEDGARAQRPEIEKRVTRARRSVEKAAAIIDQRPESTTL